MLVSASVPEGMLCSGLASSWALPHVRGGVLGWVIKLCSVAGLYHLCDVYRHGLYSFALQLCSAGALHHDNCVRAQYTQ